MKKIESDFRHKYVKLFDCEIDKAGFYRETVGKDLDGNLIFHSSETHNTGDVCSATENYYVISIDEYKNFAEKALENKLISKHKFKMLTDDHLKKRRIESIEMISLTLSGMHDISEYRIINKGTVAEVSYYRGMYNADDLKKPEMAVECSNDKILSLLKDCKVNSWDGFFGRHPRGVKDGTMFTLNGTVNKGKKIYASGSQNFPKHFYEFVEELKKILKMRN